MTWTLKGLGVVTRFWTVLSRIALSKNLYLKTKLTNMKMIWYNILIGGRLVNVHDSCCQSCLHASVCLHVQHGLLSHTPYPCRRLKMMEHKMHKIACTCIMHHIWYYSTFQGWRTAMAGGVPSPSVSMTCSPASSSMKPQGRCECQWNSLPVIANIVYANFLLGSTGSIAHIWKYLSPI